MLSANQHLLESIVSRILSSTLSLSPVIVTTIDDRVFHIRVCARAYTLIFFCTVQMLCTLGHLWVLELAHYKCKDGTLYGISTNICNGIHTQQFQGFCSTKMSRAFLRTFSLRAKTSSWVFLFQKYSKF